jgi:TRAP transporter TAXI family solute receptor
MTTGATRLSPFLSASRAFGAGFVLLGVLALAAVHVSAEAGEVRIASGSPGDSYHQFVNDLASIATRLKVSNVSSQGSVENIGRLARGEVDYALAQNDIAHYVYYGRKGFAKNRTFSALLPLFPEYVQIVVRKDSEIRILKDLSNKRISVGAEKSGTYQNALDVLEEVELREHIDYSPIYQSYRPSLALLGEGEIDAVFATGKFIQFPDGSEFRHLTLPTAIVESLSRRFPYYTARELPRNDDGDPPTLRTSLSVTSYLLVRQEVPAADVASVSDALIAAWPALREVYPTLPDLSESLKKEPLPIHDAMKSLLADKGYVEDSSRIYWYGLFWLSLLAITLYAMSRRSTYNRVGQSVSSGKSWHQAAIDHVARGGGLLVSISVVVLIFSAIVVLIQWVEGRHATLMNIENRFADADLMDGLLWVFMFITSGFTADVFPESAAGQIMVGMLGLVGVAGPIGLLFYGFERVRDSRQKSKKGLAEIRWSGHVLICGWNSKVPGLIYSLTGDDAPHKVRVVVVAESSLDAPLEQYGFDRRYVAYCRGDSADHNVLERASAEAAAVAIVVAGEKKVTGGNVGSILTVMALKNITSDPGRNIFVAAELLFEENREFFESCGVDALLSSTKLSDKMVALCCLSSNHLIDFILDAITYDDHDEIYSMRVAELEEEAGVTLRGQSMTEVVEALTEAGVNVCGFVAEGDRKKGLLDFQESTRGRIVPLSGQAALDRPLSGGDAVIYLANARKDICAAVATAGDGSECARSPIVPEYQEREARCQILLVGDRVRVADIAAQIGHYASYVDVVPLEPSEVTAFFEGQSSQPEQGLRERKVFDSIVILSNPSVDARMGGSSDARTIVTAGLVLQKAQAIQGTRPRVIAEMLNVANRRLYIDAGVDVIIPPEILVERLMAKLVYNRGTITDFLMSLISTTSEACFSSRIVHAGDGYCGRTYDEVIASYSNGEKVVAWLPKQRRQELANAEEDFATHFVMVPSQQHQGVPLEEGDELVFISARR